MYDFFLYTGTLFNIIYYITDYYASYLTYKSLYVKENLQDNRNLNAYSLKIRICVLVIDGSYLTYYELNNIQPPILSYLIFCCFDTQLFIIRLYFLYVLYKVVPNIDELVDTVVVNAIHDNENYV